MVWTDDAANDSGRYRRVRAGVSGGKEYYRLDDGRANLRMTPAVANAMGKCGQGSAPWQHAKKLPSPWRGEIAGPEQEVGRR